MPETRNKLTLPRIRRITLNRFSLFSSQPSISVELSDGVFCLAGANGIGKSTFLAAVNYAITGIVAEPGRKFESVDEYYRYSLKFTTDFFTGRILEPDRGEAEVTIEMLVGKNLYRLTRGMFEPRALRNLMIFNAEDGHLIPILDQSQMAPRDRHLEYTKRLARDVGLSSFEQFVFLQYFVFTFDERRHLLFWEPRVLEQALYLAFSVDYSDAQRADSLRREIDKAGSLARNYNWQASETRKEIVRYQDLLNSTSEDQTSIVDVEEEHRRLLDESDSDQSAVEQSENQLKDANLRLAELSARFASLHSQYTECYARHIQNSTKVAEHPIVMLSLKDCKCGLCGAEGKDVADRIQQMVHADTCPLCNTTVEEKQPEPEIIERLQQLDAEIALAKQGLDEVAQTRKRLTSEVEKARIKLGATLDTLQSFERSNSEVLAKLNTERNSAGRLDSVLEELRNRMATLVAKKEEEYARRDERQRELYRLQQELERQYAAAEQHFVPLFKDLAYRFVGLDLDIKMQTHRSPSVALVLEIMRMTRRFNYQLSESQRFFIDIALRMALAEYVSDPQAKASLFIDTPEGSLDIAYESRAGDMFARFVETGYNIVMTANINSSQLLRRLAEHSGRSKMRLCRMTTWTNLSEVQISEEGLFEKAYEAIEKALSSGDAPADD